MLWELNEARAEVRALDMQYFLFGSGAERCITLLTPLIAPLGTPDESDKA